MACGYSSTVSRILALAATLLLTAAVGSCAAISGLDRYSNGEGDASGDAGGGASDDGGADSPSGPSGDSTTDRGSLGDVVEAAMGSDASDAARVDASPPIDCGVPDTLSNCGACGASCSTTTGTPACNGTTCSYTCNAGLADCNASTAPDTDGCECAAATMASQGTVGGCCSGKCQTQHSDGLGQSFYDCNPPNTFTVTTALEACTAFTGDSTKCSTMTCNPKGAVVCSAGAGNCDCWMYQGNLVGYVDVNATTTCYCPISTDPKWN